MSGDICGCHNEGEGLLASRGWGPEVRLNMRTRALTSRCQQCQAMPELEDGTGDALVLSTSICVIPLVVSVYVQFCWHLDTRGCQVK